jgi:hypothetical protein
VRLVALAIVFAGCSAEPTTLLVDISVAPNVTAPSSLTVTVFGPTSVLANRVSVAAPSLPGRLVVRALPDLSESLCLLIEGGAVGGAVTVQAQPHAQTEVAVALASSYSLPAGCGTVGADLAGVATDLAGADLAPVVKSCKTLSHAVLLCDDFEAGAIDTTTWSDDGNEKLDAVHVHRGAQALHATNPAVVLNTGMAGAELVERKTFATMTGNTLYVRIWAFVPTAPVSGNDERLFAVQQDGAQYYGMGAFFTATDVTLDDWYAGLTASSTTPPTYGQWACYRSQIVIDPISGSFALTGVNTPSVTIPSPAPTQIAPGTAPLGQVAIGPYTQHPPNPQPAFDMWIDDVIIDDHPVDCSD